MMLNQKKLAHKKTPTLQLAVLSSLINSMLLYFVLSWQATAFVGVIACSRTVL